MDLHVCFIIYITAPRAPAPNHCNATRCGWIRMDIQVWVGLYKIFVHFKAFVHESIIRVLLPHCIAHTIAILLHDPYATHYPSAPPFVGHTPYNIGNDNNV